MRPSASVVIGVALLAAWAPAGSAADALTIPVDWTSGHFRAGLLAVGVGAPDDGEPVPRSGVGPVNLQRFPFSVDPCRRELAFDLLYEPDNVTASMEQATLGIPFEFQVELVGPDGTVHAARRIASPGHGYALGEAPAAGDHFADLYMLTGVEVDWMFRLRASPVSEEPTCFVRVNEVEANPAGTDAGHEWIELHNGAGTAVDVSGWIVEATHGVGATVVLPPGTMLAPGAHVVVAFADGRFLDNSKEVVILRDPVGRELERTPAVSDRANDGATWQRTPDGLDLWSFTGGTPAVANPE